ncbi:MAG: hypothetical protein QOE54_3576 [Streptosporangiaceae bacterium]|jgi:hypothetical protein|nr:hypothetical protein [Streptosporangiaceae bacterium]
MTVTEPASSIDGMVAALFGVDDREELRRLSGRVDGITRAFPAPARLGMRAGAAAHRVSRA